MTSNYNISFDEDDPRTFEEGCELLKRHTKALDRIGKALGRGSINRMVMYDYVKESEIEL